VNTEAQITGRRIATDVACRAAALEVIAKRPHVFSWWHVCVLVLLIAGNAWLSTHAGSTTVFVVGGIAQLGFLLAINAHVECLKLRRRIDAALVLLRQSEPR
jgi:hypothetical protein